MTYHLPFFFIQLAALKSHPRCKSGITYERNRSTASFVHIKIEAGTVRERRAVICIIQTVTSGNDLCHIP
jgi:hypothetical protein